MQKWPWETCQQHVCKWIPHRGYQQTPDYQTGQRKWLPIPLSRFEHDGVNCLQLPEIGTAYEPQAYNSLGGSSWMRALSWQSLNFHGAKVQPTSQDSLLLITILCRWCVWHSDNWKVLATHYLWLGREGDFVADEMRHVLTSLKGRSASVPFSLIRIAGLLPPTCPFCCPGSALCHILILHNPYLVGRWVRLRTSLPK